MNQKEKRIYLIEKLLAEHPEFTGTEIPSDEMEQRSLLRGLMNIRMPGPVDREVLRVQDEYLQQVNRERGIVHVSTLKPLRRIDRRRGLMNVESVRRLKETDAPASDAGSGAAGHTEGDEGFSDHGDMILWRGDITRLDADAIVNAANSGMTGCYQPNHSCIDNCIHTYAGMQLRLKCAEIMRRQGTEAKTGRAKITPAYNLPSSHVIHTVGPIITGWVTKKDRELLASCYRSCLRVAALRGLHSIAFCCISTGVFHFPNEAAAEIAVREVERFLELDTSVDRVIFNVFKAEDEEIYRRLLAE